ncbi:hypothetical protein TEA_005493 [Camellia sinensis var. sinensis]|uniref:Glycerophosphocholine acyltransferase 1 n=1 Tax=Camellia sinensis var. sinensis TaxID=542762 RepID=A0A4S4EFF8_CAMSN|nr:hypothetical protein TEA_005493 [Camellia sinensis var. sinensis]
MEEWKEEEDEEEAPMEVFSKLCKIDQKVRERVPRLAARAVVLAARAVVDRTCGGTWPCWNNLLWIVFFTIRWWDITFFEAMHPEGMAQIASLPYVESKSFLWTWLFFVPLATYSIWQALYFLIVNVLRRQRLLRDPEVMTSYRELSKKAQKANNIWWHLSGLLGEQNRLFMYIMLQALFTVATMALTVPIFLSYRLHIIFQILKVSATVWNGAIFLLEVMPRQVVLKEKKKTVMLTGHTQEDQSAIALENTIKVDISAKNQHS